MTSSTGPYGLRTGYDARFNDALPTDADLEGMGDIEKRNLLDEILNNKHGGGMSKAELQDFETLVSRLEGSKMRQAAQSNRARQRDLFAGGLASMMGNF